MKFKFNSEKPIGWGDTKKVFQHPENPDWVVGLYHDHVRVATPNQVKGRYYLAKILNILFPDNIPDVHKSSPFFIESDKKERDPDHLKIQDYTIKFQESNKKVKIEQSVVSKSEIKAMMLARKKLDENLKIISLRRTIGNLGIKFDNAAVNFAIDEKGNAVFLDTFEPWSVKKPELTIGGRISEFCSSYDENKLQKAIDQLPQPRRDSAQRFFNRLNQLKNEEMKKIT